MQYDYTTVLNILMILGAHISTMIGASGALKLLIGGLERQVDPRIKDVKGNVKREISLPIGVGQISVGILSFWTLGLYIFNILQGRPANIVALVTLAGGGAAGFSAATRDVPWSILTGTGIGFLGAYGVFNLANGTPLAAALGIIFGVFAFYGVWIIFKPGEDWMRNFGQLTSYTPAATLIGLTEIAIAVITAAGIMVL